MSQMNRIIIMANNEVGVIADIAKVLADVGINLETINTETAGDQGAIVLTVYDTDHALSVLNQAGYKAVSDDALVLRLRDAPGALAAVADSLKQAGVNIRSMHILNRQAGYAMIALTTDDRARAQAAIDEAAII
jgi:hypothetical protein